LTASGVSIRESSAPDLKQLLTRLSRVFEHDFAWFLAIGLVAALQVSLILTHTPWLDEYQALLIATEPASLSDTISQLHYEGHPFLWYLLLRLLASFIPTAWLLATAGLLCAAVIQGAILARAPFSRFERLLLALNEIFLFEYGTISRGLSIGVALIMLAMVLWETRAVWLAIALLPACEFLFGVLSLGLVALLWRERRLWPYGLALWVVCSIAAAMTIVPASDALPALAVDLPLIELSDFMERVGTNALPFQTFAGRIAWDGMAPLRSGMLIAPFFLLWALKRTRHSAIQRRFFFGFFLVCLLMSVFVFALHFRYISLLALLLIVLAWRDPPPGKDVWWCCWLVIGALCGLATSAVALSRPFDAAPQMADIIRRIDDGQRPWLAYPASRIPPLHVLTGKRFIQPEQGCSHGFVLWNHQSPIRTSKQFHEALSTWAKVYGQSYLVIEYMPRNISPNVFKPLTPRLKGYDGQNYVIGILGADQPVRRFNWPACQQMPARKALPR
jgi:hypothetical protein